MFPQQLAEVNHDKVPVNALWFQCINMIAVAIVANLLARCGLFPDAPPGQTLAEASGFAPIVVAFDKRYRAGFSTYPALTLIDRLEAAFAKYGRAPWISAEGTNVLPNGMPGAATMETYLSERFNHGAIAINIFSWGMGGEAERNRNMFQRVTENDEAIAAYRKFLRGQPLIEKKREGISPQQLQAKVHKIQVELPAWVRRTHRMNVAETLMHRLDAALKGGDFMGANATADEILKTISAP